MKLCDFILNKKLLDQASENFKNMTPDQIKEMQLITNGSAFIAGMMVELLEHDDLINVEMNDQQISNVIIKMISTGVAIGILNISTRSNDPAMLINVFKHFFEETIQTFQEVNNANN